jgi:hypothetical protein
VLNYGLDSRRIPEMASVTMCDHSSISSVISSFRHLWFAQATGRLKYMCIVTFIGYYKLLVPKIKSFERFGPAIFEIQIHSWAAIILLCVYQEI